MKKPLSLTFRLFLCVSALNIVTMVVMGLLGLRSANINIAEDYDAQLITEASILWDILEEDSKNGSMEAFKAESFDAEETAPLLERIEQDSMLDYAQWRAFSVWRKDGNLVMHSDNTDEMPPNRYRKDFPTLTIGTEMWRAFSLHDEQNGLVVETFENLHNREILQRDILFGVVGPLVVMLPVLGLLFSIGIGFGLKDLRKLAKPSGDTLSVRSFAPRIERSSQRTQTAGTHAVNTLLAKLEASLAHEREFIDHAAHELRTPLSALKLQAQLLAKSLISARIAVHCLTNCWPASTALRVWSTSCCCYRASRIRRLRWSASTSTMSSRKPSACTPCALSTKIST